MTEDIMFDNIYVGHSVDDAKALAAETFEVRKPLEVADEKEKEKKLEAEDEASSGVSFMENPVEYIRQKVYTFVDLAKLDPILAFKTHPETGAGLAGAVFTLFGMLGALFGLVGGSQKPITKVCMPHAVGSRTELILSFQSAKRKDEKAEGKKKAEETKKTPVAPADSGETKQEASGSGLTKRR